jgi:hypothetical protein
LLLTPADCPRDEEGYFEFSAVVVEEEGFYDFAEEEHEVASRRRLLRLLSTALPATPYQRLDGDVWQSRPFSLCAVEVLCGQHIHGVCRVFIGHGAVGIGHKLV